MDKDTMMMETCHASDTRITEEIDKDMSDLAEQLLEDMNYLSRKPLRKSFVS